MTPTLGALQRDDFAALSTQDRRAAIVERVRAAEVRGHGGGKFPTAKKLESADKIHTLIVNGMQSEPANNSDLTALADDPEAVAGVHATTSPSMDIQVSSNFERLLFDASDRDSEYIKRSMSSLGQSGAFSLGDKVHQTIEADFLAGRAGAADVDHTIREVLSSSGYLLDPHTAVGVHVARQTKTTSPQIVLATAHPAKFPDAVKAACGKHPELPDRSAHLMQVTERFTVIKNDLDTLENYITRHSRAAE